MKNLPKDWQLKESAQEVAKTACQIIVSTAKKAIEKQGEFKIVLAGGTTPKQVYSLLSKENCDWQKWQLYLGDERCYPADHPDRNSQMIEQTFLSKVSIPKENIHFISAEKGAKEAANIYNKLIKNSVPFDLVLLGMGEDGHTASLFPKNSKQDLNDEYVSAVLNAPKAPPERVTLTSKALSSTACLLIMVTGTSKHQAVRKWQDGEHLPVSKISAQTKIILLDKDALS